MIKPKSKKHKIRFQWFYKRNGKKHLTKKAKEYLSKKLKQYYKEKPAKEQYFRAVKIKYWSAEEKKGETPQPYLEIKTHLYSRIKMPNRKAESILSKAINMIKKKYDTEDYFKHPFRFTKRIIAFENKTVSKTEYKFDHATMTLFQPAGKGKFKARFTRHYELNGKEIPLKKFERRMKCRKE